MSFAMTERQLLDGTKTVTRRLGWRNLKAGDGLVAVAKCMGLRKGEKQRVLARLRVVSVTEEHLQFLSADECRREGFPELTPGLFVDMFCRAHGGHPRCHPNTVVRRIEFEVLP